MGIFDWILQSAKKLEDVESRISEENKDAYEIYQRNVVLEREIAQRTEELRLANQTLLTLEQVWDMMNSSRPLSNVLETIVSSLYGEFGYVYSFIAQKQYEEAIIGKRKLTKKIENEYKTANNILDRINTRISKVYEELT